MMKTEITVKQEQIIGAALRRFSHFGVAKTTMTEIADDLGLTKQSLAHYYPDKQSLTLAVKQKIQGDYMHDLESVMNDHSVESSLEAMLEVKGRYFEKYYRLAAQEGMLESLTNEKTAGWHEELRRHELQLLARLFRKGIENGELKDVDPERTGSLFLDIMTAFTTCIKEKGILPDASIFRQVFSKLGEVIGMFYQGVKRESWTS
jgi:TetR/AcrR family transcriptional regulator